MMNLWSLVYDGAIEENVLGKVNIRPVRYDLNGITVAANLYMPATFIDHIAARFAAVAVAHPNGGCKEQVAGLYAQRLAELGYVALAADAGYQGASSGAPRLRDWPENRIEDINGMVDYLSLLTAVDSGRIGVLGICGGGGYALAAARTDKRISAVATLSMFNSGRVRRNGFMDADIDGAAERFERAFEAREAGLNGEMRYEDFISLEKTESELRAEMEKLPENTLYRDAIEYYGLTHRHMRATGSYTTESLMKLMAFDAEDHIDMVDQPLLMICGSEADTLYMSKDAFAKATGTKDKELFLIEGASHVRTYWVPEYVDTAIAKLDRFFGSRL